MRVVYVDDDELLLQVAKAFLGEHGMTVTCVDDSRFAAATILEVRPDIVLLDVMMPEQDGPTTLRLLREHRELDDTLVVFVTAAAEEDDVRALMAAGADDVIAKPFAPARLALDLRRIKARRDAARSEEPH